MPLLAVLANRRKARARRNVQRPTPRGSAYPLKRITGPTIWEKLSKAQKLQIQKQFLYGGMPYNPSGTYWTLRQYPKQVGGMRLWHRSQSVGSNGSCCRNPSRCRHNSPMLPMIAGGMAAGIAGAVANRFLMNPIKSGIGKDGVLYKVAKKSSTGEWTVTAYVPDAHHGWKRHEGKTYYADSKEDAVGTFDYIMGPKGPTMMNPLTAKETRRVLRTSLMDARTAQVFQKGPTRSSMIGQALGRAETAHQFGARSKRRLSSRVLDTIHTVSHNRGGRWYVGLGKGYQRDIFFSRHKPTEKSHGRYFLAIVGPYKSKAEASSKSALMNKGYRKNSGAESNVITVPFRQGHKYSVAQVHKWVETHGTPAMKKRFAMAMSQYRRFHKGSLPKFITYSQYKMGSHPGISDVEFGVSEGHEWMAAYQVPRSSGKWVDQASGGRYVHAHGDSDIDVDVKKPVKLSKLPMRFHTPDGKAVGVIPSKNVKIGEWYEG